METFFWKKVTELCKERKTTPTAAVKAAGLSTGNVTYWRNGRMPNVKAVARLAEYFGVDVDCLIGSDEPETVNTSRFGAVSDDDLKFAFFGTTEVTEELYQSVLNFAKVAQEVEARKRGG